MVIAFDNYNKRSSLIQFTCTESPGGILDVFEMISGCIVTMFALSATKACVTNVNSQ